MFSNSFFFTGMLPKRDTCKAATKDPNNAEFQILDPAIIANDEVINIESPAPDTSLGFLFSDAILSVSNSLFFFEPWVYTPSFANVN